MDRQLQNLKLLAKTHMGNSEMEQARELLEEACEHSDCDAECWFLLGVVEGALEAPVRAAGRFAQAIKLQPSSAPAHFNLALSQIVLGRLKEASENLEKCLAIDPNFPGARLRLSGIYEKQGLLEESAEHLALLLNKEPRTIKALISYANNRMYLGDMDAALYYFQAALEEDADSIMAISGLAGLYIRRGEIDEAYDLLHARIEQGPVNKAIAIVFSNICHYRDRCEEAVGLLEKAYTDAKASTGERRDILFALGRLYDRSGEYHKAFECFSTANNLKGVAANIVKLEEGLDTFINIWSRDFNAKLPVSCVQIGRIQPVFVVGMPRSGTSLVEQILASHPAIFGAGELKDIGNIILKLSDMTGAGATYPECLEYAGSEIMTNLSREYLRRLENLSGGGYRLATDKLPTNFWNLGLIRSLFPAAKIIHCARNPLDTCISCYFTDFAEGSHHTYDLADLGGYYKQYQKIMHHWKDVIQIPMFDIHYEELVRNPGELSRRLVEYCGLEWDGRCLSPHKTTRDVTTASFTQVRERIYTSSANRWKNYEEYLAPLRAALQ